jgi:hypothetical protein
MADVGSFSFSANRISTFCPTNSERWYPNINSVCALINTITPVSSTTTLASGRCSRIADWSSIRRPVCFDHRIDTIARKSSNPIGTLGFGGPHADGLGSIVLRKKQLAW